MHLDQDSLRSAVLGAALGAAFGYLEQGVVGSRERHALKYAVLGGLGFAAFSALRAEHAAMLPPRA
jgi:hypothetical protein